MSGGTESHPESGAGRARATGRVADRVSAASKTKCLGNQCSAEQKLAEREGFEPPIPLRVCRISSAVHSTTLPPLRGADSGAGPRPKAALSYRLPGSASRGWRPICPRPASTNDSPRERYRRRSGRCERIHAPPALGRPARASSAAGQFRRPVPGTPADEAYSTRVSPVVGQASR
jgi:hypothetical protein